MSSEEKSVKEEVAGSPMPEVTRHHILFLRARGYLVETLDAAREFIAGIEPENLAGFFADAAAWQEPIEPTVIVEDPKFLEAVEFAKQCGYTDEAAREIVIQEGSEKILADKAKLLAKAEPISASSGEPICESCGGTARGGRKVLSGEIDGVEIHTHYCVTCWQKSGG